MQYLIGLDIGTSSVKGVLVTAEGEIKKTVREAFVYTRLENGGLEISAQDYLTVCFAAIRQLTQAAEGSIKGICASSASGNLLLLDAEHRSMTNIINWQDRRVDEEAREILGDVDVDALYERMGWRFDFKTFPL